MALSLQVSMSEAMVAPILCPRVMPGKQSILPIERCGPDGSFDGIVVDLDATVS